MMLGLEDYYLGWVVQPLDSSERLFYVYERDDTSRPKGFLIEGIRGDAYRFIGDKTKRK